MLRPLIAAAIAIATLASVSHPPPSALRSARRGQQRPLRVLVAYDLEGASGVVDDATMDETKPEAYAKGRESLITDVNDVIAGLFDAGVTDIELQRTHGGGTDSLVPQSRLDPRVKIRRGTFSSIYNPDAIVGDTALSAVVTVGMHCKPRSGGFSPHTMNIGNSPVINGATLTETELIGYQYGTIGVPVIFSSGDDHLKHDLSGSMPWIEYVVVKTVRGSRVEPLAANRIHSDLRTAAARAVHGLTSGHMQAMRLSPPIQAGLYASYPQYLPLEFASIPGAVARGDTITFTTSSYSQAFRVIKALQIIAATFGKSRFVPERQTPEGRRAWQVASDTVFARWQRFEEGTWQPSYPPPRKP
jgi:D-aminopeptidase